MANPQETELDVLIRARYPLIYLVSWEESRAEEMLGRVARQQGKSIFFWTVTRGMTDGQGAFDPAVQEPLNALEYIEQSPQRALFVLKDFHAFLQDPKVIRRLRDLLLPVKHTHKTVVILSPQLTVPVELEKDLTVVDYALPGPAELQALLGEVTQAQAAGGRFQVTLSDEERERLVQALQGLTLAEAESALARAIVRDGRLSIDDLSVLHEETRQIIRKSRMLEYFEAREEFGQVGGLELLKGWLRQRGQAFSAQARAFGLPAPRGILLLGVQGCGKSLTCKAVAGLWKLPLLRLDMGAIFGGFVGQSEENMRRAIKTAESVAPCVLWLDEIEKGLAGTQSSNMSDAGTTARVFSTFLTWLQEKSQSVFVAATANNIQLLPPELLRRGRLDEIFFIDLPSRAERREIWSIHLKKRKRDPAGFDLEPLIAASEGYSGAEIEQAVITALYDAFDARRELSQADLAAAVQTLIPLSRTMKEEIDALRQWAWARARPASRGDATWADADRPGFNANA